jgi:hypothetical protein
MATVRRRRGNLKRRGFEAKDENGPLRFRTMHWRLAQRASFFCELAQRALLGL